MTTNFKILGVVIFCISASLIIPKVADATGSFHHLSPDTFASAAQEITNFPAHDLPNDKDTYIPQNYGAPYSEYGTGTR